MRANKNRKPHVHVELKYCYKQETWNRFCRVSSIHTKYRILNFSVCRRETHQNMREAHFGLSNTHIIFRAGFSNDAQTSSNSISLCCSLINFHEKFISIYSLDISI